MPPVSSTCPSQPSTTPTKTPSPAQWEKNKLTSRQDEHTLTCLDWRQATADDEPFILDLTYRTMQEYLAAYQLSTEADIKVWLKARNGRFSWFVGSHEEVPIG